jgi:hypothetical protein
MKKLILSAIVLLSGHFALAYPQDFRCGTRDGSFGEAYLADSDGNPTIVLASQGGDQSLLNKVDSFFTTPDENGNTGTQNGKYYCVIMLGDNNTQTAAVISAYEVKN